MTAVARMQNDGLVLLGWKTRDRALVLLQQECEFDPPLTDDDAEHLWARYRERVNALRGRPLSSVVPLSLSRDERQVVDEFLRQNEVYGGTVREVVKVDPLALVAHQLEVTSTRSTATAQRLHTERDWSRECLCPAASPVRPTVRAAPNSVDVDLPHGEWALLFDARAGLVLGEAARCITLTTIGSHHVLWSGYHRTYAAAACRPDGERTVLAAMVEDVDVARFGRSCGLRAVQSGNPPIFADFFNPDLALPVRFRARRFTMQIRARVVADHVERPA
jgi:hypothetical protein